MPASAFDSTHLTAWVLLSARARRTSAVAQARAEPDVIKQADAAFHEGFAARQAGNLELARSKFAEVVRLQPNIAEGHEALGAVLVELGKPLDGAREFEAADKIKPGDEGIETNLALAYFQAGDAAKAIPHFESAVSLSQQPGMRRRRLRSTMPTDMRWPQAGKPDQAALQFVAEEALTGPRADLEDAIGYARCAAGKLARKRSSDSSMPSRSTSSYVRARIHLGLLFRTQKDLVNALNTLSAAAALEPPNAEALMEYGRTLAVAGKDEDAVQQFNAAIKVDSNSSWHPAGTGYGPAAARPPAGCDSLVSASSRARAAQRRRRLRTLGWR